MVTAVPTLESQTNIHVVLIHGTILFAKNRFLRRHAGLYRGWISPRAEFSRSLRERLRADGRSVVFHRFRWTGGNSDEDRFSAARRLRTKLEMWSARDPNRKFVLIAHSHGGNVVMRALRDEGTSSRVQQIICLGTPFFRYTSRGIPPIVRLRNFIKLFLWLLIPNALGQVTLIAISHQLETASLTLLWSQAAFIVVSLLYLAVAIWLTCRYVRNVVDDIERRKKLVERELDYLRCPMTSIPLINIESKFREAKLAIRLGRAVASPLELVFNLLAWSVLIAPFTPFVSLAFRFIDPQLMLVGMGISLLVALDIALFLLVWAALLLYNRVVIGSQALWRTLWIDTKVNFLPYDDLGELRVRPVHETFKKHGFEHCLIYQEPAIVSEIAEWIVDPVQTVRANIARSPNLSAVTYGDVLRIG